MKNLTNILSYLWLLLLMVVTACSDLENEVDEMQQQLQEADLVELTIRPHVPGMKAGTRSTENDALTSIKVLAFDESRELIKVVDATNVTTGTTGSFSVRVPSKTRIIHFIGNLPSDVTLPSEGYSEDALKNLTTSGDMSYWGYASFNSVTELKAFKEQTLSLYRNKAKISITAAYGVTASIAGVANAYQYGVLVPNNNDGFNFNLDPYDYQTLPSNTTKKSEQTDKTFTYVFEHPNDSKADALNVICKVGDLYYKVVLAKKVNDEMVYYDIIRNHQYNIKINQVDTNLGKANFDAAAAADNEPINDVEVVEDKQVALLVTTSPSSTCSYDNTTYTVTVTTTENKLTDISTLSFSVLDTDVYQLTGTTGVTDNGNSNYTVTADQAVFTFTLNDGYIGEEVSNSITFEGDGTHVVVTPATADLNLSTFADMYEMYFDEGKLGGSTEYDKFFYDRNSINIQTTALTTQYVDAGANNSTYAHNHVSAAINMQSNSTIKFTIAEERYLTLLVASNGDAPSINLTGTLANVVSWTTAGTTDDLTNGTYNFAAEGEITTAGRLIRYTLPAGTYTLQRGNNDYLLYYMRVTKDKPTMTDIVQPSAADYNLSWTGGEYGNYLKNGTKYYVDDDATIFTPKLTYLGLSEMPLTTTSVTVVTDTLYFKDNAQNVSGTTIIKNTETKSYNGSNPTLEFNAGTYNNLCGTIENIAETSYKYMAFYDAIQLKEVSGIEVRNTIKVGLYDDWYSTEALDHYTEGQLMMTGFKMPTHTIPVPVTAGDNGTVTPIEFRIENWTRDQSGLGIDYSSAPTYKLTAQDETQDNNIMRTHPRPEWIYRIQWANVAAKSMTVSITDNSSDAYFSHKEQIGKSVTIATAVENTSLDIDLDFYTDVNNNSTIANRDNNVYEDLLLETSRFYLKATISSEDATKYNGQTVTLVNAFSGNGYQWENSNGAINWDNSSIDANSSISSNSNATQLSFTIGYDNEGNPQTEYVIEWVFQTGSYYTGYGDIGFAFNISTYTISDVSYNNISGDTSASIAFTNEPVGIVLLNSQHQFETQDNGYWTSLTFDGPFPIGTKIILTFSEGGGIKLCDGSNNNLYVPAFASKNLYGNGGNSDLWMTAPTGNLVLDITEDIILYGKGTGTNNGNLSANNPLNRLIIESGATVLDKVVVVYPDGNVGEEEVIFNINFDNGSMENLSVVFHQDKGSQGTFDPTGGSLALNISSPGTDNWHAQITRAVSFEQDVTYKLTCKVKSTVSGNMVIWFDDPDNSHAVRVDNSPTVGLTVSNDFVDVEVDIKPNQTDQTGRFVINFGLIPQGTINIDDLKLVKY